MTRQQVADLVGEVSEAGVRKVLRRLAEQGVVIEQRIGRQYTHVGNGEHILWPAVEVFMSAADRLDTTIREHVEAWEVPALSVEVFGSVAAGTSTAHSDVDLMVYRPSLTEDQVGLWNSQVAELRTAPALDRQCVRDVGARLADPAGDGSRGRTCPEGPSSAHLWTQHRGGCSEHGDSQEHPESDGQQ